MTALAPLLIAQLALAHAPLAAATATAMASETPKAEEQKNDAPPPAATTPREENPSRELPPLDQVSETQPANAASPNEAPSTAPDAIDGYTAASNQVMVKEVSWRKVPRLGFYGAAAVGVGVLIFSVVMDSLAAGSRYAAATDLLPADSIAAQNRSISQTNAANAGFALSLVLAVGIAVLAGFTNWVD